MSSTATDKDAASLNNTRIYDGYLPGLPWGRNFYPHTHSIPTENPVGIPTGSPYPQNPKVLHTRTRTLSFQFSLQDAYFNLLLVTLTVGYYMMYVLCESVCD